MLRMVPLPRCASLHGGGYATRRSAALAQAAGVLFLPRESGGGGPRVARWRGRRLVRIILRDRYPLHHASHGPPPPLRFAPRGRIRYAAAARRVSTTLRSEVKSCAKVRMPSASFSVAMASSFSIQRNNFSSMSILAGASFAEADDNLRSSGP